MTVFKGGQVVSGSQLLVGDLVVDGPDEQIEASGLTVSHGLIDSQINGGWGHDFTFDPESIWQVGERLVETGVTGFLPTIITAPYEVYDHAIEVVRRGPSVAYQGAEVLGLHFEGPWLSPEMSGAHDQAYLQRPAADVARRWASSGVVKQVTLAAELDGSIEVAKALADAGVVVSLGHTNATYEQAKSAYEGDFNTATHLFNQMTGLHHRRPGVVAASLEGATHCSLIIDLLHVDQGALQIAWQVLGADRTVIVTDAMAAMGLGHGQYRLAHKKVTAGPDGPRTQEGRLAGSRLTMPEAIRNLSNATDATVAEALACASTTPATMLGAGSGVTLFDDDLNVVATYLGGKRVWG